MTTPPNPEWGAWAAGSLGGVGAASTWSSLRDESGPWVIRSGDRAGVLRVGTGPVGVEKIQTEVAALRHVREYGVPVPQVVSVRIEDNTALELIELVDGDSAVPFVRDDRRLRSFGAVVGRISKIPAPPYWPRRETPIASTNFAAMLRETPHPLLEEGWRVLAESVVPDRTDELVHGDLWHGNTLWRDGDLVAVIDWDHAGRGSAGMDLGTVRFDAALYFDQGAEDAVLEGWEAERGESARDVAYWDLLAAVSSPPDLAWFVPTMIADGARPDLDRPTLVGRRDTFLEGALRRLKREKPPLG